MIAVDTNILVYAHRPEFEWHEGALQCLRELAAGSSPWAIPWPCAHEFLSVTSNRKAFANPTAIGEAVAQLDKLFASPKVHVLAEAPGYWPKLRELVQVAQVSGPKVHDARIAALCLHHGVRELWTADRDFGRFPALKTRNPLVG